MKEELITVEITKLKKKVPRSLPYLSHNWDRMDEYHQLNSSVNELDVVTWFAVIFKRLKD